MIIRSTQKLAKILHTELPPALPPAVDSLLDWHATVFQADRDHYFLLMNSVSLYSVVLLGDGIQDQSEFYRQALTAMRETMAADGLFLYAARIASQADRTAFCKTTGPSPLASMSNLANRATRLFLRDSPSPIEVGLRLNHIPYLALRSNTPREAIEALARLPVD